MLTSKDKRNKAEAPTEPRKMSGIRDVRIDMDTLSVETVNEIAYQLEAHRARREAEHAAYWKGMRRDWQGQPPVPVGIVVVDEREPGQGGVAR